MSAQWQPPERPEWVKRLNEEGDLMAVRGLVPLDEKSLLDAATGATGLEDFGSDEWREPFKVLLQALEKEAQLNLMGRIWSRSDIIQLLKARLQIEATYKRHPEIEDQQIREPYIIIGQGRCGTSYLQDLLATNPDNMPLLHWEGMFPCPPPEAGSYRTDRRIQPAHQLIDLWNRVTPSFKAMHEFGGEVPMEDMILTALTFISPGWINTLGQIPSYNVFLASLDFTPAYAYHKRVLKLLQWKNPRKHWVLKDVTHIDHMPLLCKIYPDAHFIWPHRDPVRASASALDIAGTIQWGRTDHPFGSGGSFEYMTDPAISAARFNRLIEQIESGIVPKEQLFSLLFRDLIAEPMQVMARLYEFFGIEFSEENRLRLKTYLERNPRHHRPAYKYTIPDQFEKRARVAYKRYQDYFAIPTE